MACIDQVGHEVVPAFEGNHLENGDEPEEEIIEGCNPVANQWLPVHNIQLYLLRVATSQLPWTLLTFCRVHGTKHVIVLPSIRRPTPLVHHSFKLLHPEDRKQ